MKADNHNKDDIDQLRKAAEKQIVMDEKLDELIALLANSNFDSETIKKYQSKLDSALKGADDLSMSDIKAFEAFDDKENASREQLLDDFSVLLKSHKFDSKSSTRYLKAERANKFILMTIGAIMITLGFAMIIMPAPPYFEMFTIFYFSRDNGVTLMDLISLIIVFAGIYVFVRPLYKKSHTVR